MKKFFSLLSCLIPLAALAATDFIQQADSQQRGWYDRPYIRYEAESENPNISDYQASILAPTDDQRQLQSEASNQTAMQLLAKGNFIEWVTTADANALTIRFSLPDSNDGKGTKGQLAVSVNNKPIDTLTIDSYWAWQYTLKNGGNYPDNQPADNKFARMRFDETHILLSQPITAGSNIRLTKIDDNNQPYTIDFIELETAPQPKTFSDIKTDNKVQYSGNGSDLAAFINNNGGKTIFLPAGRYECPERIYMQNNGTKLIGAGEWHTEIYFAASSDNGSTYSKRGIEAEGSNLTLEGLYLNTINNKRYYNNNASNQVGKGLMGSWGNNSRVSHVWIEHFECGAWIANYTVRGCTNNTFEYCRFRNNYADGINLCCGAKNNQVIHSSFRNNGDDDMASWSTGQWCEGNTFAYCTAENNWRASSLGFFGGKKQTGHHLLIIDPLECGIRINADFTGTGFGTSDSIRIHDVTIIHAGCKNGTVGTSGDFWGNSQGAFNIGPTGNYALQNISAYNIDIIDARHYGMYIYTNNNRQITATTLNNIMIQNAASYGMYVGAFSGKIEYCNINYINCTHDHTNYNTSRIVEKCDEQTALDFTNTETQISGGDIYNMHGQLIIQHASKDQLTTLMPGIYIHRTPTTTQKTIIPTH